MAVTVSMAVLLTIFGICVIAISTLMAPRIITVFLILAGICQIVCCVLLILTAAALRRREEVLTRMGRRLAELEGADAVHFVTRTGETLTCPRCGQTQAPASRCASCGVVFLFDDKSEAEV